MIKELNQKLKKSEQERDSVKDANSDDSEDIDPKKHFEKEQKFYCDVCLYRSTSENEIRMHMRNRHNRHNK